MADLPNETRKDLEEVAAIAHASGVNKIADSIRQTDLKLAKVLEALAGGFFEKLLRLMYK